MFEEIAVLNNVLNAAVRVAAFDQPHDVSIYLGDTYLEGGESQ